MAKALGCDLGGSLVLRLGRPGAGRGPHGPCGVGLPSLPARAGIAPLPSASTVTAPRYYNSRRPPRPRKAHLPTGSQRAPGPEAFWAL